jgi:type II secretory pathway component GspD/PulD (secretin)
MNERDYRQEQKDRLTDADLLETVQPLHREIVGISNVQAADMSSAVEKLLSERGEITVVAHNNSLIIYDTRKNIQQIRNVIAELDVEVPQVSIAAKIIEVSSGSLQNLGIQWGFFGELGDRRTAVSAEHLPGENVIANAIDRLTYGILSADRFAVALEYLFMESNGEVVAQPSITTLDNKQATIFMGSRIPLITKDEAGNNEVTYEDAGTELTVTPHITDGRRIVLEINAKKESPDAGGNIQSQNANTNVVVSNGETVVIAGLTSNENQKTEDGIPVLKNLPLIGNLFKRTGDRVDKRDLVIFVTPHIIEKSVDAALAPEGAGEHDGVGGSDGQPSE